MAKFVSRNDIHAEAIQEINQEIEILRNKTHDSQYLSSTIALLNNLDPAYFTPIVDEVKQMFDIMKYYIDKDKNKELINPEIPHLIENYLHELALLIPESDLNQSPSRQKTAGQLSADELTNFSLQEKMNRLQEIEHQAERILATISPSNQSEAENLAQSDFEPKVIEGLIKQNDKFSTKEIIRATRFLMKKEVTKANANKNHYRINTKWFWILVPILLIGMILTIILPLFI